MNLDKSKIFENVVYIKYFDFFYFGCFLCRSLLNFGGAGRILIRIFSIFKLYFY